MNTKFVVYRPGQFIPPRVISQLQKIHFRDGMMWPCFRDYKNNPESKLILSIAEIDGVARSWTIIFSRYFFNGDGDMQMGKDRYIHSYTQKSFRNKGLNKKCVENALRLNLQMHLSNPITEGNIKYWKHNKFKVY
jgi:hypothetical protein